MKTPLSGLFLAALLCISSPSMAKEWRFFDKHTDIRFTLSLLGGIEPQGKFTKLSGTVNYDATTPEQSKLSMRIATTSLEIDLPKQFQRLADNDFFQTKTHPYMSLVSRRVRFYAKHRAKIVGNLTFMGVTQPVLIDATIKPMRKNTVLYFDAKTTIKRSDFGVKLPIPGVRDSIPISMQGFLIPKSS